MTDWHPDPDQLLALALAEPDAAEQERLALHLAACPSCHEAYAQLSDGVQQVLASTPSVAPDAGFSGRVLTAMTGGTGSSAGRRTGRPAASRLLLVACILAGLLAGVGGTLGVGAWLSRPPASAPGFQTAAAQLVTDAGVAVGSVGVAGRDGRRYLVLNVTEARPGAHYECILVGPDGSRRSGGSWTLSDEYGRGTASGSWLVPLPEGPPARVELVAPGGTVWARGAF